MSLKKSIKSHPLFWLIKLFFKRLVGRELWVRPEIKLDTETSGDWSFSTRHLADNPIIYSLGVGDSIEFDLELTDKYASTVHAFDPTPDSIDWLSQQEVPENFVFHQWAVAGADGTLSMVKRVNSKGKKSKMMWTVATDTDEKSEIIEVPSFSISSIMEKLQHDVVDLIKMDIEGTEYEVIDSVLVLPTKPAQLLIEFHHRFPSIGLKKTKIYLEKLKASGYKIFAVSQTGREMSFIHKSVL